MNKLCDCLAFQFCHHRNVGILWNLLNLSVCLCFCRLFDINPLGWILWMLPNLFNVIWVDSSERKPPTIQTNDGIHCNETIPLQSHLRLKYDQCVIFITFRRLFNDKWKFFFFTLQECNHIRKKQPILQIGKKIEIMKKKLRRHKTIA